MDTKPGIIHCGCWAHVRRKFNDVVKAAEGKYKGKGKAKKALSIIGELYLIEREVKNRGFDGDQTFQLRQEKSKPIVEEFEVWLKGNVMKIPPKSLLGKTFNYTLSQLPRLVGYLEDGILNMDNNHSERNIRNFVVTRKISGGSRSEEGARTHAILKSIIQSIRLQKLSIVLTLKNYLLDHSTSKN